MDIEKWYSGSITVLVEKAYTTWATAPNQLRTLVRLLGSKYRLVGKILEEGTKKPKNSTSLSMN